VASGAVDCEATAWPDGSLARVPRDRLLSGDAGAASTSPDWEAPLATLGVAAFVLVGRPAESAVSVCDDCPAGSVVLTGSSVGDLDSVPPVELARVGSVPDGLDLVLGSILSATESGTVAAGLLAVLCAVLGGVVGFGVGTVGEALTDCGCSATGGSNRMSLYSSMLLNQQDCHSDCKPVTAVG